MTTQEMVSVSATCTLCADIQHIDVPMRDYLAWRHGEFVQNAFHYLTPAEREFFFQSRICGDCWDNMFSEDDE